MLLSVCAGTPTFCSVPRASSSITDCKRTFPGAKAQHLQCSLQANHYRALSTTPRSTPTCCTAAPEKPPAAGTPRPVPTEIRPDPERWTRAATSPRARRGCPGSGEGERRREGCRETTRSGLGAGTPPACLGAAAQPLQHPAPTRGARPVSLWRVQLTIVLPAPEETAPCEAGRGGGGFRRCGNERTLTGAGGTGCDV